jgi:2-oxo-4-hydroxy-4-carboxy-5-ureidoimidazoline decarboxylase
VDVEDLNAMTERDFVSALDGTWERSPWVAEAAWQSLPFQSREDLAAAMWLVVRTADREKQLALLRAHPDLGGKLARAGGLTVESTGEQASLGLDRLSDAEFEAFTTMNDAYRERFEFPFIICVRDNSRASIKAAFERRLGHSREQERQIALDEVRRIAEYRLSDRVIP